MKTKAELQQDVLNLNMEVAQLSLMKEHLEAKVEILEAVEKRIIFEADKTSHRLGQAIGFALIGWVPLVLIIFFPELLQ